MVGCINTCNQTNVVHEEDDHENDDDGDGNGGDI